jgi:hypothetical protein
LELEHKTRGPARLQLDERRSGVIKTEEPRADRKLPGQPSRRWMMHQSLHTLLEVGTGVSFGSGATASTVDPLCHATIRVLAGANMPSGPGGSGAKTPEARQYQYIGEPMEQPQGLSMVNSQYRLYILHLVTLATPSVSCPLLLHTQD